MHILANRIKKLNNSESNPEYEIYFRLWMMVTGKSNYLT